MNYWFNTPFYVMLFLISSSALFLRTFLHWEFGILLRKSICVMLKVRISLCCHSSLCVWFPQMCSRALRASIDTNRLYTVNVSLWVISVSLHWPQCIVEQLLSIQRNIDSSVFPFAVRKWHSKCWSCMVWSMIIMVTKNSY